MEGTPDQQKNVRVLTPDEAITRQRHIDEMHGILCPLFMEIVGPTHRTLIGLGGFGMHVRYFDTSTVTVHDEGKGMDFEEELDRDLHSSIDRESIKSLHLHKMKSPDPENSEEQITSWLLTIIAAPNVTVRVSFSKLEDAVHYKDIIWNWRFNLIDLTTLIMPPTEEKKETDEKK